MMVMMNTQTAICHCAPPPTIISWTTNTLWSRFILPTTQQCVTITSFSHRNHWAQVGGEAIYPGAHKPVYWAIRTCPGLGQSHSPESCQCLFVSFSLPQLTQITCVSSCGLRCHWLPYQSCRTRYQVLLLTRSPIDQGRKAYMEWMDFSRRLWMFGVLKFSKWVATAGMWVGSNARLRLPMEHGMKLYLFVAQRAHVLNLSSWPRVCRQLCNRTSRWMAVCSSTLPKAAHLSEMHQ